MRTNNYKGSMAKQHGRLEAPYLLSIESFGRVERLDERGRMTDKQCIARGTRQHADHGQPDVRRALRRIPTKPDTQHV